MKYSCISLFLLMLLGSVSSYAQYSEWQIFVPGEPTIYQDNYTDHNHGLIIGYENEGIYFGDYVPFNIPDQTAVSGFSLIPTEDVFTLWLTFSNPIDQYLPGDVIECIDGICELNFSSRESLSVPDSVIIDALHYTGQLMKLSFNIGFEHQGQYIDPKNLYSVATINNQTILTEQTSGSGIGFGDNSNLTAYSDSFNGDGYITYINANVVYDRSLDLMFANELLRIDSVNPSAYYAVGYTDDIKSISAYHGLHSGIVGFVNETLDVSENAGMVEIEIYRENGSEGFIQAYARSQDGTAVESVDFNFVEDFVPWQDGDSSSQTIPLNIIDNQQTDGNRTLYLTLESGSLFASIFPVHEIIEIRIIDDEGSDLIFEDGFE